MVEDSNAGFDVATTVTGSEDTVGVVVVLGAGCCLGTGGVVLCVGTTTALVGTVVLAAGRLGLTSALLMIPLANKLSMASFLCWTIMWRFAESG